MKLSKSWFWAVFVLVIVVFNGRLWGELFSSNNTQTVSDGTITEFIVETAYQQIKTGHNPFTRTYQALYPFGVNFSLNDPGVGVLPYYAVFRQFMGVHKSMIIVLLTNIMLTGWLMFIFLKSRKISDYAAGLGSLVFTFTPFLSHRLLGHYTYVTMFVFPLTALLVSKVLEEKSHRRAGWAVLLGFTLAWTLYLNFYYFIMIGLSVTVIIFWKWRWANVKYWILTGIATAILLTPWIMGSYQYLKFENRTQVLGFGGAIFYSSELKNFILPSAYNPVYKWIFAKVGGSIQETFLHNWERMVYPGILLIGVFGYWVIRQKKLPDQLRRRIDPWMWGSLIFGLLSMGPFLKLNGSIELLNLEGVAVVLPLPFLLLHYIPGLESLRVPGRFAPAMIFMAVVGSAYLLDYILIKMKHKKVIMIVLVSVFLLDQWYQIPQSVSQPIPTQLYEQIGRDQNPSTVLEIPFTVRDGFQYIGFVHAIEPMQGAIIHKKPIIGGYFARVSEPIFSYYRQLPFIGYIAEITDRGNYNPLFESPKDPILKPYTRTILDTQEELDFLGISYLVVKMNEPYFANVDQLLIKIGATKVMDDGSYRLYQRTVIEPILTDIQLGGVKDYLYVSQGFAPEIGESRKMIESRARLFLRSQGKEQVLTVAMSSPNMQVLDVYLNEQKLGTINTLKNKSEYRFEVKGKLRNEINELFLDLVTPKREQRLGGIEVYRLRLE